ncbi:MAG: hypothetical protein KAS82_01340, partial [Bacteroidales bacterium]|nr:hypothetical protein [Bacteroidales bacterium]
MTWLKQIGFKSVSILLLLLLAGSGTITRAQELIDYPFKESRLAVQQGTVQQTVNVLNYNPLLDEYDVKFYGLDVEVNNRSDQIHGSTTILVEVKQNLFSTLVFELHHLLYIDSVLVDGTGASSTHSGDELYIDLPAPRDSGTMVSAQVFYGGQSGEGMVMETDEEWGVPVTYTSSEPFYSKDWFPCKEKLTDKADSVH